MWIVEVVRLSDRVHVKQITSKGEVILMRGLPTSQQLPNTLSTGAKRF